MDSRQPKYIKTSTVSRFTNHRDATNKNPKYRPDAAMSTWLHELPEQEHWNLVSRFSDGRDVLSKHKALLWDVALGWCGNGIECGYGAEDFIFSDDHLGSGCVTDSIYGRVMQECSINQWEIDKSYFISWWGLSCLTGLETSNYRFQHKVDPPPGGCLLFMALVPFEIRKKLYHSHKSRFPRRTRHNGYETETRCCSCVLWWDRPWPVPTLSFLQCDWSCLSPCKQHSMC